MTTWGKVGLGLVVVVVVGIIGVTIWIAASVREQTVVAHPYEEGLRYSERAVRTGCDLADGPCTHALDGGGEVTLEIGPRPLRTMRELAVRATLRWPFRSELLPASAANLVQVSVSFSMPGMEMGENRVVLSSEGGGGDTVEGRAVLVRCLSGRRDWIADLSIAPAGAAPRAARFAFRVEE